MTRINWRRVASAVGQTVVGLSLIVYCGDAFHDELFRPNRSMVLLGALGAGMLLGALIVPGAWPIIFAGAKRGVVLGQLGRRAYDGTAIATVDEIELPPPESKL